MMIRKCMGDLSLHRRLKHPHDSTHAQQIILPLLPVGRRRL